MAQLPDVQSFAGAQGLRIAGDADLGIDSLK
jgi:hypothetical protein